MSDTPPNPPFIQPMEIVSPGPLTMIYNVTISYAAKVPWWVLVIVAALATMFYAIFTSNLYSRAFNAATGNFHLTTNRLAVVSYVIRSADGSTSTVLGTLTSRDNNTETIITQDEQLVSIPQAEIANITCGNSLSAADCPVNSQVTVIRGSIQGKLTLRPSPGQYSVVTPLGQTVVIDKVGTTGETRNPPDCESDPAGNCTITLILKPDYPPNPSTGILVDSSAGQLTIQTKPPISVTIDKANIVKVNFVNDFDQSTCALNKLGSCTGIFLTVEVTFAAFAISMLLGLVFGLMRVSKNVFLYNISTLYVEVIRGIPIIVVLFLVQFALPPWLRENFPGLAPGLSLAIGVVAALSVLYYLLARWRHRRAEPWSLVQPLIVSFVLGGGLIVFIWIAKENTPVGPTKTSSILSGIIGLAIVYGAYLAELFRGGIQSVSRGQMEAARSLGMTYVQAMRHIVLPQAIRIILPPLGNDFIAMLKDSSLVAFLSVPEMTYAAQLLAAKTFRPFEPLITIAVLYLVMTLFLSLLVRIVERRMSLAQR